MVIAQTRFPPAESPARTRPDRVIHNSTMGSRIEEDHTDVLGLDTQAFAGVRNNPFVAEPGVIKGSRELVLRCQSVIT
jgi:hypothetical protein